MIRDEIVAHADLIDAVTEALKRKGVYNKIKSSIRTEVYHVLEDKKTFAPEKPNDVYLASELIREFMMKFKLSNSLSVFCEEFGQPVVMNVDRELLGGELGLNTLDSNTRVPLLISLIQHLVDLKSEKLNRANESLLVEENDSDVT